MIRVERGTPPDFVDEPEFQAAREHYEAFRSGGGSRASQTYLDVQSALGSFLERATEYVDRLFGGKCAYTEVICPPYLHLHRPEGDAYDDRLPSAPNHYWWTAFWYRNWYRASSDVVSLKRNIFPVLGERAAEPEDGQLRSSEVSDRFLDRGVLLDPCEDHPQLHLRFLEDGTVEAWADQSAPWLDAENARRGQETIKLLDLNSHRLVRDRRKLIGAKLGLLSGDVRANSYLLDTSGGHSGAARQVVAASLLHSTPKELTDSLRLVAPELVPLVLATPDRFGDAFVTGVRAALQESHPGLAELLAAPAAELRGAEPVASPSLPPEGTSARPRRVPRTAVITKIVIRNFQAIEDYELEVTPAVETTPQADALQSPTVTKMVLPGTQAVGPSGRPWRVFLGENGSGKSSALRAMALALAGDQVDVLVEQCDLAWNDLLRRGTTDGQVRLELTGGDAIDLRFTPDGPTPESRENLPRTDSFVRGFGATRLNTDPATGPAQNVRLGNLFDPLQPVVDAQEWLVALAKRQDQGDFNVAAVTVARLLGRGEQVLDTGDQEASRFIERVEEEIWVADEPLRTLSDGYRAIITLACDLMAGAGSGLSDMRNASGIVLVDELGCYLHPRWKMQITRTLREVFPSMQFFVTTHEPLCLRGLVEREVVRVTPSSTRLGEAWHAVFETIEESPSRYRIDRLLTSEFFGLSTTIDPDVEQQFLQYYKLVREPTAGTEEQRKQLRANLSQHGILGYTARDQLIYDAIDLFLAESPQMEPGARRLQRQKTLEYVADIWRNVAAQREGGQS